MQKMMVSRLSFIIYHLSFLFLLSACTPTPENIQKSDLLPPLYPDYCDVTIPVNIAPLNFLLRADCEAVEVKAGDLTVNYKGNEVVFDCDEWKEMLTQNAGKQIQVTVTALIQGRWIEYKTFNWNVVKDKLDPYLTYRLIEPDYEIWNHVQIQQRCVENFEVNALGHHEQLESHLRQPRPTAFYDVCTWTWRWSNPESGRTTQQVEHTGQCLFLFQSKWALYYLLHSENHTCFP